MNDPPISQKQQQTLSQLHPSGFQHRHDIYNTSGVGVLQMAYQGLKAASMLERVQDVALAAHQQQEKQVLQDLIDLQALIAASSTSTVLPQSVDHLRPAASSLQRHSHAVTTTRESAALEGLSGVTRVRGASEIMMSSSQSVVALKGRHEARSVSPPAPLVSMQPSVAAGGQDPALDEAYSDDGFEELVSPYHSHSDIPEEEIIHEEGDAQQSPFLPVRMPRAHA